MCPTAEAKLSESNVKNIFQGRDLVASERSLIYETTRKMRKKGWISNNLYHNILNREGTKSLTKDIPQT